MTTALAALGQVLPADVVVSDPDRLESYRTDRARFCPAGTPAAVVLARETAHVQRALEVANRLKVPVVPQGARSGLSGAANAVDGCIVVATDRMNRILEIDPPNRLVVTEPGVFNADLSRAVAEHQATLQLRPASARPLTMAALFSSAGDAAAAVSQIVAAGHVPSLLEIMDRTSIRAAAAYLRSDLPADCAAMLLAESDAGGQRAADEIAAIASTASRRAPPT